jgi:LysR family transcriptional activator of nhaA
MVIGELNYKHLRYFWTVARVGTIAGAARLLGLAPHSISSQLASFESNLGVTLFRRVRRRLELTEAGERILGHAEEIFALGDQIVDLLADEGLRRTQPFRIGMQDALPKSVVHRLIAPAFRIERPSRLLVRESSLTDLLSELAVHRLDLVMADRPVPPGFSVRAHSMLLGDSALSVFAHPSLTEGRTDRFPRCLDRMPFLLPSEDVAYRGALLQWFKQVRVSPLVVAEIDDSALMKAFGEAGAGAFAAPGVIAEHVVSRHGVGLLGEIPDVCSEVYAITTERRLHHPVFAAIRAAVVRTLRPAQ